MTEVVNQLTALGEAWLAIAFAVTLGWLPAGGSPEAGLGLHDGSAVTLANASGSVPLVARLDDGVLPGTAVAYKGRWPSLEASGTNVNFVHTAQAADMGASSSVHSTLVTIEKA